MTPWPTICRSAPVRSKVRIAILRSNASNGQAPGGAWTTPNICWRCASTVETAIGRPIGPRSAKPPRPQIRTDQPDHENPQRECITLDRTRYPWGAIQSDAALRQSTEGRQMAAATLSVGVLLAILEAAPEIRVPFRVDSHHSSKVGGKSQGGRRDRNQPYRESPQRECITLDRTPYPW